MFDYEAYRIVSRSMQKRHSILARVLFGEEEFHEQLSLDFGRLIDNRGLTEIQQRRLRAVLYELFPQAQEKAKVDMEIMDRDNRVCHAKHFPNYFQLVRDPGEISASTISAFHNAKNDPEKSRTALV